MRKDIRITVVVGLKYVIGGLKVLKIFWKIWGENLRQLIVLTELITKVITNLQTVNGLQTKNKVITKEITLK